VITAWVAQTLTAKTVGGVNVYDFTLDVSST
jgi:hypothetical protein